MIKNYSYLFLLLFISTFCMGQNCTIQKVVSDPTICSGESATTTLFASETGISYQLIKDATAIGAPQVGNGGNLNFVTPPISSSTTCYIYASYATSCGTTLTDESTVTVTPLPGIALTSANATQTRCQNTAIANITYNV